MKRIKVALKERSYEVLIGSGLIERSGRLIKPFLGTPKVLVVTTPSLKKLFGPALWRSCKKAGLTSAFHVVPEGEDAKTARELFGIYEACVRAELDRFSGLIALGGGAVGDVAAFAASTYLRGIAFFNIPTTLLAQVDSAIGGKTAINIPAGKNLVGTFYQPRLVLSDLDTLKSLPEREYRSSLAEVVKYGCIASPKLFERLEREAASLLRRDEGMLRPIIAECAKIKGQVVSRDEREMTGLRAILNFGHTFAHAYEKSAGYGRIRHGEAVAIGMCEAARLSVKKGMLASRTAERIESLVTSLGLSTSPEKYGFSARDIRQAILRDKKRKGSKVHFILISRLGKVTSVPLAV